MTRAMRRCVVVAAIIGTLLAAGANPSTAAPAPGKDSAADDTRNGDGSDCGPGQAFGCGTGV